MQRVFIKHLFSLVPSASSKYIYSCNVHGICFLKRGERPPMVSKNLLSTKSLGHPPCLHRLRCMNDTLHRLLSFLPSNCLRSRLGLYILDLHIHSFFFRRSQCHGCCHLSLDFNLRVLLFHGHINLFRCRQSICKRPKICREEHAMGPPSFLAPKLAKVVRYSIIGRLGERLMRALAETVVSLCDLPYCRG